MRRWMAAPLIAAAAFGLTLSENYPTADAQDLKVDPPSEETFLTADGLQLRGLFHKSAKDQGTAPVVILLYPPGKDENGERDMSTGDWVGLANRLAREGYHVFRFDWRGHGKKGSDIKDTERFWGNPYTGQWNAKSIVGSGKKPFKTDLYLKDIKDPVKYAPTLLLDLAAVRAHLDSKNDSGG